MRTIPTSCESLGDRPKAVRTKEDFTRRYLKEEFGNRAPSWDTLGEYLRSGYKGLVHIRNRVAGGPTWYNVEPDRVADLAVQLEEQGHTRLYYSGMCPTEKTTFQGEVRRSQGYLDLYYSRVAKPMRQALSQETGEPHIAGGAKVPLLLQYYMDPSSYDWLQELLD